MSMICLKSPHPLCFENGSQYAVLCSLLLGLNACQSPQTLRFLSHEHAGTILNWLGRMTNVHLRWRKHPTELTGTIWKGRIQGMIETRGAADQLLASAWMELEGRMPCCCPTSLSPVTLHHYWSDTNLIHCPISSQQISHRHTTAINLGAILNAGWGILCLHKLHAPTDVSKSLFPKAHLERN